MRVYGENSYLVKRAVDLHAATNMLLSMYKSVSVRYTKTRSELLQRNRIIC